MSMVREAAMTAIGHSLCALGLAGNLWRFFTDWVKELLKAERSLLLHPCLRCLLFQVNGIDLRSASHEEAITALRQTPQKVRLVVYRGEAHYRDEENLEVFPVDLQKKAGRGLGLSIVGKR